MLLKYKTVNMVFCQTIYWPSVYLQQQDSRDRLSATAVAVMNCD